MNQSEHINELATALAKAQCKFVPAKQSKKNPFHKNDYSSLEDVWDVCRVPLSENGLCIIQGTNLQDGKTVLVTKLVHASGQWIESIIPLTPSTDKAQDIGGWLTYMKRYSLTALLGIVSAEEVLEDDGEADRQRQEHNPKQIQNNKLATEAQIKYCLDLFNKARPEIKQQIETWMHNNNIKSWDKIPSNNMKSIIESLK